MTHEKNVEKCHAAVAINGWFLKVDINGFKGTIYGSRPKTHGRLLASE